MKDEKKTKDQLLDELRLMRKHIAELEEVESRRKRAEEQLLHHENILQVLAETIPDLLYVKDFEGRVLMANPAALRAVGKTADQVIGRNDHELHRDPDIAQAIMENDRRVMRLGQVEEIEETIMSSGSMRTFLSIKAPYRDPEGQVIGLIGASRDITERKRADEALRQEEAFKRERKVELEALMEAIPSPVWFGHDPECRVITGSREAYEILGLSREYDNLSASALSEAPSSYAVWRDSVRIAPSEMTMQRAAATGKAVYRDELKIVRTDGSERWIYANAVPLLDDDGAVRGCVCVSVDITERKEFEKKLKASEATARTLLNIPNALAFLIDREGNVLDANETLTARLSVEASELIGKSIWDLLPKDLARRRKAYFDGILQSKRLVRFEDERDGNWYDNIVSPILDQSGEVLSFAVIAFDITERKEKEIMLRRSEENLKRAQSVAKIGSWHLDISTSELEWSAETYRIFGTPSDAQLSLVEFVDLIHPDDREMVIKAWNETVASGARYDIEHRIVADGQTFWVREVAEVERDAEGRPLFGIGTVQEITERKLAEEQLEEKTEHLTEVNAALRALLRQREEDKKDFEDVIMSNFRHLIMPYLESLKKTNLSSNQKSWIEILESNLNQITSTFTRKLTRQELNLSNAELRVASLVRDGKSTKEIAEILVTSEKTVSAHRDSIRAKLGLRGKKGGLRYLLMNLN